MEADSKPFQTPNDAAKCTVDGQPRSQDNVNNGNKDQTSQPPTQAVNKVKEMEIDAPEKVNGNQTKEAKAEKKLDDLLQRSKVFAEFVAGKRQMNMSSSNNKKKGSSSRRGRMQESEEDAILLKQEGSDETLDPVRLMTQPSNIEFGTMRQYQLNALNWMIRLHDIGCNGILADEMGLGKTLESISLLAYLKQYRKVCGPHLVIVPKSTSGNWMREFKRWCPSLSCMLFHGSKEERVHLKPKVGSTDVCVTTYSMCVREKSCMSKINWYYIYIDEAHRIKNEEALLSQVVRSFPSKHRLLITGTPLQNNLHELWALLNFLLPDVFDSSTDFETWFDVTKSTEAEEEKKKMVKRLHTILRPFLLRRLKKDVETDLPPKVEMKVFTGLSVMQKAWYTKLLERDIDTINSKSGSRMRLLNIVMQLRKVCNHPYLFKGAEEGPPYFEGEHIVENCGKMVLLDKLLKRLKERGSRVLIFSTMTRMLDILEDYCRYRRYRYCRIDGQTAQLDRDSQMDVFNAPDSSKFIFLLSTRAGGLGINLQTADTVVLYDSDWNPQMDLQAMDRAHRIGQKKPVNVYRFVTDGTVEVKVVERAYKKLFLNAVVIREGRLQEKSKGLKSNELMKMVRFGAKEIFRSKEATVSEEDIDEILKRSEERTKQDEEEIKGSYDASLRDFSLDVTDQDFQTFEGKSYSKTTQDMTGWFIAPSKRERKIINYKPPGSGSGFVSSKKKFKATLRYDFQFFQRERLAQLEEKIWKAKKDYTERVREEKKRKKMQAKLERQRKRAEKAAAAAAAAAAATSENDEEDDVDGDDDGAKSAKKEEEGQEVVTKQLEDGKGGGEGGGGGGGGGGEAGTNAAGGASSSSKMEVEETTTAAVKAEAASAVKKEGGVEGTEPKKKDGEKNDESSGGSGSGSGSSSTLKKEEDDSEKGDQKQKKQKVEKSADKADIEDAAAAGDDDEDIDDIDDDVVEEEEEEEEGKAGGGDEKSTSTMPKFLSDEEQKEKDELEEEGFRNWTKQNLNDFVNACATYGRDDLETIKNEVTDQSPEEVERYYHTFWPEGYLQLKDAKRIISKIEKGEKKLAAIEADREALAAKIARHKKPLQTLSLPYPNNTSNKGSKGFSAEEDRFLVYQMHHLGYGNWEQIQFAIRNSWQFRFNWFIKSRNTKELSQRCKKLLDLVKEDNRKFEEQQKKKKGKKRGSTGSKKKKAASGAAGNKRKRGGSARSSGRKKRK